MNSLNTIFNLKKIAASLIFCLFAAAVSTQANDAVTFAKISKADSVSLAAKSLSKKLQNDLVLKSVSVKFSKIEGYLAANGHIGVRGEGTCRLDGEANDLPLNFDVKIDTRKRAATDVRYVFLNMEGATDANSVLTPEDVITEKLLQKIKNDFKSENIVIAIDFLESKTLENGENAFTGAGEIRLNGFDWKKISFDVRADTGKAKAAVLKYEIK
jgi:hypothetical protein